MTPEGAIRDWLRRMGDSVRDPADAAASGSGLTRPPPPVLSSMEIVKRRVISGRQVVALTYRDTADEPWSWIIRLLQDDDGSWRVCGGGGGGGNPRFDTPYVNIAGSWGEYGLALGGWVSGGEPGARGRLTWGEMLLEDDTDRDVVLFVTSEPAVGARAIVELLAADGSVLWVDELELDE
jgi:hypothetical protein